MSVFDVDIVFVCEFFVGLGFFIQWKMMGGLCLYYDGIIFSIFNFDGLIWFKGVGIWVDYMIVEGWEWWIYICKDGKIIVMFYWLLLDLVFDDFDELCRLVKVVFM